MDDTAKRAREEAYQTARAQGLSDEIAEKKAKAAEIRQKMIEGRERAAKRREEKLPYTERVLREQARAAKEAAQEEAKAAEKAAQEKAESDAFNRLFAYQPGNYKWEYCTIRYSLSPALPNGGTITAFYPDSDGVQRTREIEPKSETTSLDPLDVAGMLGRAGWEVIHSFSRWSSLRQDGAVTRERVRTGTMHFKRKLFVTLSEGSSSQLG